MTLALHGKSRTRRRILILAALLATLIAVIAGVLGRANTGVEALQIDSSSGTWTGTAGGANIEGLNTNEIRWGGSTASTANKSGYRWDGIGAPIPFDPGESFLVGKFTHFNLPITSGTAPTAVTLSLPIVFSDPAASANLTVTFGHDETPNSANPCAYTGPLVDNSDGCADRVALPSLTNQQFQVGDNLYVLTFTGFLPLTGQSCPADPTGPGLAPGAASFFYTKENAVNVACVYGTLTYTAPVVSVHKAATPASVQLGDPLVFTIEVWNASVAATGWSLSDTLPAGYTWTMTSGPAACGITGNTLSCTGLDVPAGTPQQPGKVTIVVSANTSPTAYGTCGPVTNNVSIAKGDLSDNASATATIVCPPPPVLTLDKSADPQTYSAVGQVIHYSYLVKNTGGQVLSGPVTVTDDKVTVSCPTGDLAPNQTITCTASHTITQADLDAGSITNVAQAHAGNISSNEDTETVTAVQGPAISLDKTATSVQWSGTPTQAPLAFNTPGDVINYTLVATNTGNVTLTNVTVSDPLLGSLLCTPSIPVTLDPGDSVTCTGSYTVTQASLDAGKVDNTATATGKPPSGPTVSDTDDATVPGEQSPALALVKTASPASYATLNQAISYSYDVTNSGNVTLPGPITVLDDKVTVSCPPGALAPGQSITCTATYLITQSDLDNGSVTNVARAYAGQVQSNEDDETVTAVQSPAITLTKTVAEDGYDAPGDVLHYTLVAKNTGNVTLTNVTISDPLLGTLTCTQPVTLAPGQSLTCTGTYTVVSADILAGKVQNTASTKGTPPAGPDVTATDDAEVPAIWIRAIDLVKTASPTTYSFVGQQISYTYRVTNTGNIPLTGPVTVTDDKATVSCPPGGLQPGEWLDCTATYTITEADLDAGSVINVARASTDGVDSNEDDETVTAVQSPAIQLVKTATNANWSGSPFIGFNSPGDIITYTLVATNTGNVTLTDVTISDPLLGTLPCDLAAPVTLAPGDKLTCTGSHAVTQADVDSGKVDNTATATGKPPMGPGVSDDDDETVNGTRTPAIHLTKTVAETSYTTVGQVLHYTLVAKNIGNVTLTNVAIADPLLGALTCDITPPVTLAPGQELTCTGTYTVTLADINAGKVENTATATGTPPAGPDVSDDDDADVPAVQLAELTLTKDAGQSSFDEAGDILTYTLIATNTGNVTLTNVTINDPLLGTLSCDLGAPVTLDPGEQLTCTGSYTVTQADVDAGEVENVATVTGKDPGGEDVTDDADETVPAIQSPAIELVKTATNAIWAGAPLIGFNATGDIIEYTLVATNTGNVTLSDVAITDPKLGTLDCDIAAPVSLAPGEKLTCTGAYAITLPDLDAGKVDNVATVTGTPPAGDPMTDDDDETVNGVRLPAITLEKAAAEVNWSGAPLIGFNAPGDVITYTLVATNVGNVTLTNVTVNDPKLGTLTCDLAAPVTLEPGEQLTCTGTYVVTQADVDAGVVENTAAATGTPPAGDPVSDEDDEVVDGVRTPGITLAKEAAESSYDAAGDVLHYTLVATNTGNVTLTDVTISDPKLGTLTCDLAAPVTLLPGEQLTCTGSYTVTQADLDAGEVENLGMATGTPPGGGPVSNDDDETVPAEQRPGIELEKTSVEIIYEAAGDVLHYTLVATNVGNVTLTSVTISDPKLGDLTCDLAAPVTLLPGEQLTCTGSYTVTQADVDAGEVENTATATGTPPAGDQVSDEDDEVVYGGQVSQLELVKSADRTTYSQVGEVINYTYVVTNTGNVTLAGPVTVADDKTTVACPAGGLAPRESMTCTASYTVTQADLDAGFVTNVARASSDGVDSNEDDETVDAVQQPAITLVKTAAQSSYAAVGDVLTYTLVATNTGNVTLTNVTVADPKLGTLFCVQPVTLAPGEQLTCTGSYTVTQADVDAGSVLNAASATGAPPAGPPVTDDDDVAVPGSQSPAISLVKTVAQASYSAAGQVLNYTLVATNTGNVTLSDVTISDPKLGTLTCNIPTPVTLAPGGSLTCTGTYTVTETDVLLGRVDNTATVVGTPPGGPAVTDTDSATVPAVVEPGPTPTPTPTETPGPGETPTPSPTPVETPTTPGTPVPTPAPTGTPIIDIVEGERTPGPGAPTATPPATPKPPQTGGGFAAAGYGGYGIGFLVLGLVAAAGGAVVAWYARRPREAAIAATPAEVAPVTGPVETPAATGRHRPGPGGRGVLVTLLAIAGAIALALYRSRRR